MSDGVVHMMRLVGLNSITTLCPLERRDRMNANITNVPAGVTCIACRDAMAKEKEETHDLPDQNAALSRL